MAKLEHFIAAITALGKTDRERAAAIGVSTRSIMRYRNGELLPRSEQLLAHPNLLRALADDAERQMASSN